MDGGALGLRYCRRGEREKKKRAEKNGLHVVQKGVHKPLGCSHRKGRYMCFCTVGSTKSIALVMQKGVAKTCVVWKYA